MYMYNCTAVPYKALQMADARKRAHRPGLVQFLQSTSSSVVESYRCLIQLANCCNHAVRGSVVWRLTPEFLYRPIGSWTGVRLFRSSTYGDFSINLRSYFSEFMHMRANYFDWDYSTIWSVGICVPTLPCLPMRASAPIGRALCSFCSLPVRQW